MTHFELQEFGKELGLIVETCRYRDMSIQRELLDLVFRTQPTWSPRGGTKNGDIICVFTMHYQMTDAEYNEACAKAFNTLNQYKSWRPQA